MKSQEPASMAAIGTHDQAFQLLSRYLSAGSLVADLAAGQGAFTQRLAEAGHTVVPVDANADDWKLAGVPLRVADLDGEFSSVIKDDAERFDAIAAIEIIEHLENPFRFIRECSKLLKPGGVLLLTSPNVESVFSRVLFLYTGRLDQFNEYETVRPAHITPIFKWKLDMMLEESGFETLTEEFNPVMHPPGANWRVRAAEVLSRIVSPFVKGVKGGQGRIVVARLK